MVPMEDQENGGCLWCGNTDADSGPPQDEESHEMSCAWRKGSYLAIALNEAGWVRPELLERRS